MRHDPSRFSIPGDFWSRPPVVHALTRRDGGALFALVQKYAGASQSGISMRVGCMSQPDVSRIMSGKRMVTDLAIFESVADGLDRPDAARVALGLAPRPDRRPASTQPRPAPATGPAAPAAGPGVDRKDDDPVRRRSFLGLAAGAALGAVLGSGDEAADGSEALTAALLGTHWPSPATRPDGEPPDVVSLRQAVAGVKTSYQSCRYTEASRDLSGVLAGMDAAANGLDGDERRRVDALAADAWHVAASVALKLGNEGPAWLAAHHSMRAAEHSHDPLAVGRSARIMTHVLMDGRQHAAAHTFAARGAQTLAASWIAPTAEALSVYGALLLRGAIAAARHGDRAGATVLLEEADQAARRLGGNHNHGWTAFGPANVALHRVNVAITLGDAGTAIDHARRIQVDQLPIPERRASLFLDVATAFAQWGKHDQAYRALRAVEAIAPRS